MGVSNLDLHQDSCGYPISNEVFVGSCQGEHGATLMRCWYIFSEGTASSFQVKLKDQEKEKFYPPRQPFFSHVDIQSDYEFFQQRVF